MINVKCSILVLFWLLCFVGNGVAQESTSVVVRAQAKDAKFIGSSMGGVAIVISETETGKILAEGTTEGSTGDTNRLVSNPQQRYGELHTEDAAKFEAHLTLNEPTFVTITARGPLAQKQSAITASTQLWLIPGKDITGDGVVMEMPGFAIDILQPQAHERNSNDTITITANVVMMCGCPIEPGGLWDSNEMEFVATIAKGGQEVSEIPMDFTGKTSTFEAEYTPQESGAYQITVHGFDPRTGNTGVDQTTFIKQ
ncbi:hypothetical protein [Fodinibius salsisoli]|uniref:Uncharacterized protein n=1 Tax=Fodinibius salsisoli TaxID=2820877 RepID=A0ABT3PT87_9BACT|nr:hypothetical protein [Fodinibius salsisoli]MCW9709087.1 hypothetical protein [Fodinibius salsisoli]